MARKRSDEVRMYPKDVYNIREDITRENMRRYDAWQDRFYEVVRERYPDYFQVGLKERMEIRKQIESEVGTWTRLDR